MFKLNKKVEYALIALKHMSTVPSGKLTSAKEICDAYDLPFDPTSRVLQIMTQKGILHASQGAHGGYQILKDLSKIDFLYFAEMISGPIYVSNCSNRARPRCNRENSCNIIQTMFKLNDQLGKFLKTFSIRKLIEA